VGKIFTRAKAAAGIDKQGGVHSLRHAYATHQLEAGMPTFKLQRLLGHTDMKSTLRYVHWLPSYQNRGKLGMDLLCWSEASS
jgi:site-specific recombinase XerD